MINRRDFLKIAGAVVPYWGLIPIANAQASLYSGKFLVDVHASGGLDASSWCDPREKDPTMNNYAAAGTPAGVAGNIRVAPMGANIAFFQANFSRILVINGVNSETNSHEDGTRAHATGMLAMNYPSMPEAYGYTKGKQLPLAWLNSGAFMDSVGLIPATPMPDGNSFRAADFAERGQRDERLHEAGRHPEGAGDPRRPAEGTAGRRQSGAARAGGQHAVHRSLGFAGVAGPGVGLPAGARSTTRRTSAWSRRRRASRPRSACRAAGSTATVSWRIRTHRTFRA